MLKSIKILLVIDAHCDYEIWKMDVKTTFSKGNLSKDMCMTRLEVFTPRNEWIKYENFRDPFMD